jgi:uncharacterized SAM-binding protein YcdF (DUF218 family)
MFFILSKLLTFLITPILWVIILLIWSVLTKIETRKKKLFWSALIVLYVFSNEFLMDMTVGRWEFHAPDSSYQEQKDQPYSYAIVLGGMTWYDTKKERPQFLRSGDRLFQAIWLLKQQKVKKILISGGSGSLSTPDIKEAGNLKKWMVQIGIPDSLIVIENASDNTHENAVFSKKLLDSLNYKNEKVLLITSAAHMRRSIACFKKAGITNLFPYPTDSYSSAFRIEFDHCLIPNAETLTASTIMIHEMVGYLIYKMEGYC